MAQALIRTVLYVLCGLFCGVVGIAAAMGPGAPFTPPKPATAVAVESAERGTAAVETPVLTGIRHGPTASALIDGRWLGIGARIGHTRVFAIGTSQVTLAQDNGTRLVLSLTPSAHHISTRTLSP